MIKVQQKCQSKLWIATVTLQTVNNKYPDNNPQKNTAQNIDRMAALFRIISTLSSESKEDGVVLFPGGWFHNGKDSAESIFPFIEDEIKIVLQKIPAHIIVSLGVDGSIDEEGYDIDQMAIVLDKSGIIAISRKFHVLTKRERERVHLAHDHLHGELGKPRIFSIAGIRFFPAICYDTYAPQQRKLLNPGVDVILSHVHYFVPNNESGPKGVVDFVRKGFAGSSAQWHCPVFGAAIFIRRQIPKSWCTGMNYRSFSKSYMESKISDNNVIPIGSFKDDQLKEGPALIHIYDLNAIIEHGDKIPHSTKRDKLCAP